MGDLRVLKIFQGLPDQLKRLGGYSFDVYSVLVWQGVVASGSDAGKTACVLDIDSSTWADNNRRAILIADPAQATGQTDAFRTQSHAYGQFIDGSVRFRMYLETPESWTGDQAKFGRLMQHCLLGQQGAPLSILYCANDTEPTIEGVNGAGASASFTSAGLYLPYGGFSYPGGV